MVRLALLAWLVGADAAVVLADTGRPNPDQGPTVVTVDIFVLDLDTIDNAAQNFEANVYFEATWKDARLADKSDGQTVKRPLDDVWHPRLQILNQQRVWASLPDIADIEPDGTVRQRGRVWGYFSQPLDLREFPFDAQQLNLTVVAAGFNPEEVTLLAGANSGISDVFSIADWRTLGWRMTNDVSTPGLEKARNSGVALVLDVERRQGYYWIKVIAPLVLIVAMSWAVFWVDPRDGGTKISIAITAMLTLIAYRFAIGANLPAISYLTRLDVFILLSTILIYASLIVVLTTTVYTRKEKHQVATRIDEISRWAFPLFFIASWVASMMLSA